MLRYAEEKVEPQLGAVIEYRDWASGKIGTVNVRMLPNLPELYQRISTSQPGLGPMPVQEHVEMTTDYFHFGVGLAYRF